MSRRKGGRPVGTTIEKDPITQYLGMLRERSQRARDRFRGTRTPKNFRAMCRADTNLREETLACLGVDCPKCLGFEEVLVGIEPAQMTTPPEGVVGTCDLCKGRGVVLPEPAEKWRQEERHHAG